MRADGGGHSRARRTAPQRAVCDCDAERLCISEDIGKSSGQILGGCRSANSGPVLQHKDVVPALADLSCVRETFMQRSDVGESASWTHNRERSSGLSTEEEETHIPLCRFYLL